MSGQVTITLLKSKIGCTPNQKATLEALGLRKIRQAKTLPDTPAVRGMIYKVNHLVEVKEHAA
ncbi:50S ribosomal protein L30 [Fundidesulfovibrio magnetotacticus]|uniref:50S ribosomal protein L30 n=1 Tax=Fundidesulfovibrio magnetotacticus TaxID=2730080 RepID=A0A6V8LZJ8_9BACT|nr:50S ribosomal protein L30 [Fundidesulfovibrio magnetotacticus]GFK95648.1 50S ribosomal protein L30 [Fundidesulfovibrio magnetotacticus]